MVGAREMRRERGGVTGDEGVGGGKGAEAREMRRERGGGTGDEEGKGWRHGR